MCGTSADILAHHEPDKSLIVTCDASARGVGAELGRKSRHSLACSKVLEIRLVREGGLRKMRVCRVSQRERLPRKHPLARYVSFLPESGSPRKGNLKQPALPVSPQPGPVRQCRINK
ncbi:unnamed protein product [Arctia plantaginis]|uniref:Uncharacterized protein n=1 Tax=Arctia plantaginis TaxID=874455 RepID=A0A8S1BLF5_ARCPL|nr:unnamed protein product [Arctia plantaginis]